MPEKSLLRMMMSAAICAGMLLVAACGSPGHSPYAPGEPVNGAGEPVDRVTGVTLPGIFQGGI